MRIRTVKPEFWRSPDTAELDMFTRLLFIGLWNYVDDNGVGEDDVSLIRSDLFPRETNVDELSNTIHGSLSELSQRGHIARYRDQISGRRYLHVSAWHHQKINRPTESRKPLPSSDDSEPTEESSPTHEQLTEDSLLYQGIKGRDQGVCSAHTDSPFCDNHPHGTQVRCGDCANARTAFNANKELRDQQAANELEEKRRQRESDRAAIFACQMCDDLGRIEIDDEGTLSPCDHLAVVHG